MKYLKFFTCDFSTYRTGSHILCTTTTAEMATGIENHLLSSIVIFFIADCTFFTTLFFIELFNHSLQAALSRIELFCKFIVFLVDYLIEGFYNYEVTKNATYVTLCLTKFLWTSIVRAWSGLGDPSTWSLRLFSSLSSFSLFRLPNKVPLKNLTSLKYSN